MSESATIPVGTLFRGRYEVESLLGTGGFGNTYVVLDHERFKRKCVLKELLPKHEGEQKVKELFEREARTLDRLNHPGIPRLEAYFAHDGHYYLVEAFVEGQNLAEVLEKRGPMPETEVIRATKEILDILKYLHGMSPPVIHRDIKPSNLMITDDGHYKLIDFGAVREALSATTAQQVDATAIGTPGYMPPEQHRGQAFPASDLYALGATALHLLTGRPPTHWYDAREGRWTFDGHLKAHPSLLRALGKLLADLVPNRYSSAQEVLKDLIQTDLPRQKLIDLIRREGHTLINDPIRCEALLGRDAGDYAPEVSALIVALKDGIPKALLDVPTGISGTARITELAKRLQNEQGLSEEMARWAVQTWQAALESRSEQTELKKVDPKPDPTPPPWKNKWIIGAAIVALLFWLYPSSNSLEIEGVRFFGGGDNLATQISQTTPIRTDYRTDFRSNEMNFVYYDLRLARPTSNDIALDVLWLFPNGAKVLQEPSIKTGSKGVISGWGFKQTPNWAVGRYRIEFSRHGNKIATAEFNVSPGLVSNKSLTPPSNPLFPDPLTPKQEPNRTSPYDIASIQGNVIGQLRFYEGPRKAPPVGSRIYKDAFSPRDSRWIWGEINITNAGNLPPQSFTLTVVWSRNGAQVFRGNYDFSSPKPGENVFYSVSFGADKPGLFLGTYGLQIYAGNKLLRTGKFTVNGGLS